MMARREADAAREEERTKSKAGGVGGVEGALEMSEQGAGEQMRAEPRRFLQHVGRFDEA